MIRAVLDTNVLAAGLITAGGTPGRVLDRWTMGAFELVVSPPILVELERTLAKPYFRNRLEPEKAQQALDVFRAHAVVTRLTVAVNGIATHAADDLVVAAALSADAGYLVTGDAGLLGVKHYRGVGILTPRDFLATLDETNA